MKYLLILLLGITAIFAQDSETEDENSSGREFWKADLPGGNYMVDLAAVTSLSNHAYILDGSLIVTEVTIDTAGATIARFYQISPLSDYEKLGITNFLKDQIQTLNELQASITGIDPTTIAQKQYPTTTHAKTVEYQISTLEQLQSLYRSASRALERNTGTTFRIE